MFTNQVLTMFVNEIFWSITKKLKYNRQCASNEIVQNIGKICDVLKNKEMSKKMKTSYRNNQTYLEST